MGANLAQTALSILLTHDSMLIASLATVLAIYVYQQQQESEAGISPSRIYVQFNNIEVRSDFGWNNKTFG